MRIDVEKLKLVADSLAADVSGMYAEAGTTIGCINGVYFRLVALDAEEADAVDANEVYPQNECILPE